MVERVVTVLGGWGEAIGQSALFALIGVITAAGQLLASKEELTPRIVLGRCMSSIGLGMSAGIVLLAFPSIPPLAQIGCAAAIASLGTSGLERIIQRILGVGKEG